MRRTHPVMLCGIWYEIKGVLKPTTTKIWIRMLIRLANTMTTMLIVNNLVCIINQVAWCKEPKIERHKPMLTNYRLVASKDITQINNGFRMQSARKKTLDLLKTRCAFACITQVACYFNNPYLGTPYLGMWACAHACNVFISLFFDWIIPCDSSTQAIFCLH